MNPDQEQPTQPRPPQLTTEAKPADANRQPESETPHDGVLASPQRATFRNRLRTHLVHWGRRLYWSLPVRWRQPTVDLAYRISGSLFQGLPDYQRWLARRSASTGVAGTNMVDLDIVRPLNTAPEGSIAIHAHVYYSDLAKEIASYLRHMPYDYDLFVSVTNKSAKQTCLEALRDLPRQNALVVEIVPNRGRDIAPMFCTFGAQLTTYAFIAHIHTKKSLYNEGRTRGWREYLLDGLFGDPQSIRRIFRLLTDEKKIGMVYPQTYVAVPYYAHTWLANRTEGTRWCHQLGIGKVPSGYFDMPAGSMFWARTDALLPLFAAGLGWRDFPEEQGQTDGTLAHTIERLLGVIPPATDWSLAIMRDKRYPGWSRWRVDQYFGYTAADTFERLSAPDIQLIVFDIFDTLLVRPLLDPELTKDIVAARVGGPPGKIYLAERATIEHQARQRLKRDVSLEDIYREWSTSRSLAEADLARLRATEEATELASVQAREEAVVLLRRLAAAGKRVVIASDTFLPTALIETMLARHGIVGWQRLYLSNEVGLRKDTGALYDHLLREEDVTPNSVIMVGDNERSDLQIPVEKGIRSQHVLRTVEIARALPRWHGLLEDSAARHDLHWSIGLGLLVRHQFDRLFFPDLSPANMLESAHQIGYCIVGPLTVAFAQWLVRRAAADGITHLYFLAREGQLLYKVYEKLREATSAGVTGHYLVLSRRSVIVPMIEATSDIHALAKARFFPNELAMYLSERYGLSIESGDLAEFQRLDLWKAGAAVEVRDNRIDHLLPLLKFLEPRIMEQARSEHPALMTYLKDIGIDSQDNCAVVDVGYSATIQARLTRLLGKPVHGYYMITTEAAEKVSAAHNVIAQGCYGSGLALGSQDPGLYRQSFELEKLLSSNEKQVLHYRLEQNVQGNAKAIPHFRDVDTDDETKRALRAEIQAGAFAFVDEVIDIATNLYPGFEFPPKLAADLFDALVDHLSEEERALFSSIVLDDFYCGRGLVS
jgi:FMN phosphatase YigB (HAD superfamily)